MANSDTSSTVIEQCIKAAGILGYPVYTKDNKPAVEDLSYPYVYHYVQEECDFTLNVDGLHGTPFAPHVRLGQAFEVWKCTETVFRVGWMTEPNKDHRTRHLWCLNNLLDAWRDTSKCATPEAAATALLAAALTAWGSIQEVG